MCHLSGVVGLAGVLCVCWAGWTGWTGWTGFGFWVNSVAGTLCQTAALFCPASETPKV